MNLSANDLLIASAFASAAYDVAELSALRQAGWTVLALGGTHEYIPPALNGGIPGEIPGTDTHGFYLNGNAAAIAAFKDRTLVLSFRGSDFPFVSDYIDAIKQPIEHYNKLQEFIAEALLFAQVPENNVGKVIVTGHSLGGAMAQLFATDFTKGDGVPYSADANYLGLSPLDVNIITFGNPGLPTDPEFGFRVSASWSSRIANFGHTADIVFNHTTPVFDLSHHARSGENYDIELTTIFSQSGFPGDYTDYSPFVSDGGPLGLPIEQLVGAVEHKMKNYFESATTIANSTIFADLGNNREFIIGDDSENILSPVNADQHVFFGLRGSDWLAGGGGNDLIDGGSGVDQLEGRSGNDVLIGGAGQDRMSGGIDSDRFVFDRTAIVDARIGVIDWILDYSNSEGDVLDLSQVISTLNPFGTGTPLYELVQAEQHPTGTYSTLFILDQNDQDWIPIARLNGVRAGNTLSLILQPSQTAATAIPITVQQPGGDPSDPAVPSTWSITPSSQFVNEGGSATFTVSRSDASMEQTIFISTTINQGTYNEADYAYWLNEPYTFPVGQLSHEITIQTNQDPAAEGNETFGLIIQEAPTDPVSTNLASATFTIRDDDTAISPETGVTFTGTSADDTWSGTSGNDTASGNGGNDRLMGNGGNDSLQAGSGNDYVSGGEGNDVLYDSGGSNTLLGGAGNDTVRINGSSTTIVDGGAGVDTLELYRPDLTTPVAVNVVADGDGATYAFSLPEGTSVSNVELLNLTTGSGDDRVTFANTTIPGSQFWNAGAGNDTAIVNLSAFSSRVFSYYSSANNLVIGSPQPGAFTSQVSLQGVENLTVHGGSGNDQLLGIVGNNTLLGNYGDDDLRGDAGNDFLFGGAGNDVLYDTGGTNTLLGGAGNDTLTVSGPGNYLIDGGVGTDRLYFDGRTQPMTVSLTSGPGGETSFSGLPDGTTVSGIELVDLYAGSGNDQVTFANVTIPGVQRFSGNAGTDSAIVDFSAFSSNVLAFHFDHVTQLAVAASDASGQLYRVELYGVENLTVHGGSGNDSLQGLGGDNTLFGNDGNDSLFGGSGNDLLSGGAGNDRLQAGEGNNTLLGGDGNDDLSVSAGNSTLRGEAGDDTLTVSSPGNYLIDGGVGTDRLYFDGRTQPVTVSLTSGPGGETSFSGLPDGTTVSGIELVDLYAGSGNDQVTFANVTIPGVQRFSGNAGTDSAIVDFSAFSSNVLAFHFDHVTQLAVAASDASGQLYRVELYGVENLTVHGGSGNDSLQGLGGDNTLFGNDGNDNLFGSSGNDFLSGGEGDDYLSGGAGADIFGYTAGSDTIADLTPGIDRIDLTGVTGIYNLADVLSDSSQDGTGPVIIDFGNGDVLALRNVLLADLMPESFVFRTNAPPTDIALTTRTIAENSVIGTIVAALSASDPDTDETFTFSLIDDTGGIFSIAGSNLVVAGPLDYATASSHRVTVRATDSAGNTFDKTFTIEITDVNQAPTAVTLINGTASITESSTTASIIKVADIVVTDDALGTNALSLSGADASAFEIVGSALYLQAGASLDFETKPSYSAAVQVNDTTVGGTPDATSAVFTLNVTNINEAPTGQLSISDNSPTEGQALLALPASVLDPDGTATSVFTYQWQVFNGADWTDISGATNSSFTPTQVQVGRQLRVVASYIDDFGAPETVTSDPTGLIGDSISGSNFADVLTGTAGEDAISGNGGNDRLNGFSGNDSIDGGSGSDTLDGGAGNDVLTGRAGNDIYVVDSLADMIIEDVGGGTDEVRTELVSFSLDAIGNVERLVFTGVGNFTGTGNVLNNEISGGSGNDILTGAGGADTLRGFAGEDRFVAIIADGNDNYQGGPGIDTYYLSGTTAGATVSLATGRARSAQTGNDSLSGVENVVGSEANDSISGNGNANMLDGGSGADTINGGTGADRIIGSSGNDILTGGAGSDTFVFQPGFGNDQVNDFDANPSGGQDFIDVSAFGITTADLATRVTITDVGADTLVTIDGALDQTIRLVGLGNATILTQADFLL